MLEALDTTAHTAEQAAERERKLEARVVELEAKVVKLEQRLSAAEAALRAMKHPPPSPSEARPRLREKIARLDRLLAEPRSPSAESPPDEKALAQARSLFQRGQFAKARAELRKLVRTRPTAEAWFWLAESEYALGRKQAAVAAYRHVVKTTNPFWAAAMLRLGTLLYAQGRKAEAKAALSKLIRLAPASPEAKRAHMLLDEWR